MPALPPDPEYARDDAGPASEPAPADLPGVPPEMADEPALVARVRAGDSQAYDTLVRRYLKRAYAVAQRMLGNSADAEDVVQDAFLRALERIAQCGPGRAFGPWFFRILITQGLNHQRSQKVRRTEELPDSIHNNSPLADAEAEASEIRVAFRAALAHLPEMQRTIVQLSDIEGYGSGELAAMLDMPAGTVRWHLHQARKFLRQALAAYAPRGSGHAQDGTA
ncbi:MAG: sigma-70 family RNA polymerase sigma factor [Gemmatimonadetes bacterium]|nr:sigma-70 family RNA polymerase sigma factor [Gemmatimonadota bacterium]